jgi:hypothetical protein
MSKEPLDSVEVDSLVEQVGRKAVTKGMNAAAVIQTGFFFAR